MGGKMLSQVMLAFANSNIDLARIIARQDDEVDAMYARVFTQIMGQMADAASAEKCRGRLRVARGGGGRAGWSARRWARGWAMRTGCDAAISRAGLPWMGCSVRVSTLLVASSEDQDAGSARMARAMASSWRWPWLRLLARSVSSV